MAKDKPEFYRAKEGFGTVFEGAPIHVAAGELVRAGHPILKRRESLFEPVYSFGRFDDVEQATSAPGEKRGRPKRASHHEPEPEPAPEPEPEAEPEPEVAPEPEPDRASSSWGDVVKSNEPTTRTAAE